jgi:hypothetical protein
MTKRTRYFMAGAGVVMAAGLCTGLVAYYGGFPALSASRTGPNELSYVPADTAVVAYADVQAVMSSQFRQKLREAVPVPENERNEFEQKTGIDIERDVEYVVAALGADVDQGGSGVVFARGVFDQGRLEALAQEHGGRVQEYRGKKMIVSPGRNEGGQASDGRPIVHHDAAVAFIEPGLVALGNVSAIRKAIDANNSGQTISGNEEMMRLVGDIEPGSNAWAVGRFDALRNRDKLPAPVSNQLSAVKYFAATGHVNGGVAGTLRAEARDDAAAENLRDVFRGLLALARMQGGADPRMSGIMQSLQLSGEGRTVVLSFSIPAEVVDLLGEAARQHGRGMHPGLGHDEPPQPPE